MAVTVETETVNGVSGMHMHATQDDLKVAALFLALRAWGDQRVFAGKMTSAEVTTMLTDILSIGDGMLEGRVYRADLGRFEDETEGA